MKFNAKYFTMLQFIVKIWCYEENLASFKLVGEYEDTLVITGINITSIKEDAFKQFSDAKHLKITKTSLTTIPTGIKHLVNLQSIIYDDNRKTASLDDLQYLPTQLKKQIKTFSANRNMFKALPDCIGEFTNLIKLFVTENQIKYVPMTIGNCENLLHLDLSCNNIDSLPSELGECFNLAKLVLTQNNISNLDCSFAKLQNLMFLDLSYNTFVKIPVAVCAIQKLRLLTFKGNQISEILPSEKDVELFVNEIKLKKFNNPDGFFIFKLLFKVPLYAKIASGFYLRIYNSKPTQLTKYECALALDDVISHSDFYHKAFSKLKTLILAENDITYLPDTIRYLNNLEILDLSANLIKNIHPIVLMLPNLFHLDLSQNFLTYFPYFIWSKNLLNMRIDISNNDISNRTQLGLGYGIDCLNSGKLNIKTIITRNQGIKASTFRTELVEYYKQSERWNIENIKKLPSFNDILNEAKDISDNVMLCMWDDVLSHFLQVKSSDFILEQSFSTLAVNKLTEPSNQYIQLIKYIANSNIIIKIQKLKMKDINTKENNAAFITITRTLHNMSYSESDVDNKDNTIENKMIKSYYKLVFAKFLFDIVKEKDNENELLSIVEQFISLCVNALANCITGQYSSLAYYYINSIKNQKLNNDDSIIENILTRIGDLKNTAFDAAVTFNKETQSVHNIQPWRNYFSKRLGLYSDFKDPWASSNIDFKNEEGEKFKQFLACFSIDSVVIELMFQLNKTPKTLIQMVNTLRTMIKESKEVENKTRQETDEAIIYEYVVRTYFEYNEDENEYPSVDPISIKANGVKRLLVGTDLIIMD